MACFLLIRGPQLFFYIDGSIADKNHQRIDALECAKRSTSFEAIGIHVSIVVEGSC